MTHDERLEQHMYDLLSQRGVTIKDIAHIVYDLQVDYVPHITIEQAKPTFKKSSRNARFNTPWSPALS